MLVELSVVEQRRHAGRIAADCPNDCCVNTKLQRGVSFRWACNKCLRTALTTFATNSRFDSPWAGHYLPPSTRGR